MTNITDINNTFLLSGCIDNYNELTERHVATVINCRMEQHDDISELSRRNIAYYWIPFADATAPRRDQIETFLDICNKHTDRILIHCTLGVGRSAFLAIVYLVMFHRLSLDDALKMLKRKRPIVSFNECQLDKLKKLYGE